MTTRENDMLKRQWRKLALIIAAAGFSQLAQAASTPERIVFDGNVLFNNSAGAYSSASGPCTTGVAFTYTVTQLATTYFTRNRVVDPMLIDPYNLNSPRWDPQQLSPLNCKYSADAVVLDAHALDAWFQKTDYVGAIPYRLADPTQDWTTGWIYTNTSGGLGRTDINYSKPVVILSGPQASSMTLSATNNYLLRGKVNMLGGTTLTIPAGTYLFGEKATTGYLVIDRGAKIFVNGTKAAPVVLTSDQDPTLGAMAPGDNGGVVIHGRAIANCANTAGGDSCTSEGGAGYFGGGNDDDNSGTIRYMRIEYSGKEISIDNELNSLTMNAVGRGTAIDYVQACLGSDDAFEWFGGTARCSHLVATGQDDDGLDWQLGYRGDVQFAVVQQYPLRGDKGIEADNSEFNFAAPFRSNPIFSNITLVGTNGSPGGVSPNRGIHLRRGTAGTIVNSVILGFNGPGLDLTDPETFANCPGTPPAVACQPTVSSAETDQTPLPRGLVVLASPNPLFATTRILFGIPSDRQHVRARIFDAQGRLVETLYEGAMNRGEHALTWSPSRRLPTGPYFFRVEAEGGFSSSGKLVLVR
jgi:FlgD Ig-like domain